MGPAHTDAELAFLLAATPPGQDVLDLGDLPVVAARMGEVADPDRRAGAASVTGEAGGRWASRLRRGGRAGRGTSPNLLWAILTSAYAQMGFDVLCDDGFRAMVLAHIVEPTSKAEVVRSWTR